MIYGYARVSTDGQSVEAQMRQLRAAGARQVFREIASGAKTDRSNLRRVLDQLADGDVLMVTPLDRLARSTRNLLNTLDAIAGKGAGFRSLGDTWADTTTAHGRLMLTVLGGLAEFEREQIRARTKREITPIDCDERARHPSGVSGGDLERNQRMKVASNFSTLQCRLRVSCVDSTMSARCPVHLRSLPTGARQPVQL
jgi:DNA invertase Pin-like site-specific DNA recombinase